MATISKINVNGTEYGIRSYVPFASTVPQKIGTFQGCDVYQIIVELTADDLGSHTYAEKKININDFYDILNFSGIYSKYDSTGLKPYEQEIYYPIPERKNIRIEIFQNHQTESGGEGRNTDITVTCDFWNQDTAKKDTSHVYVTITLIKKTRQ